MMEELRLTQSGLANSIGLNQNAVSNWLNGKSTMPENTARAIEQAHRVRWQWLLNGEGAMLLDDMGNLSENEVRLLKVFRHKYLRGYHFPVFHPSDPLKQLFKCSRCPVSRRDLCQWFVHSLRRDRR